MEAEQLAQLDALLDLESGLTPWELDFVESLDKARDRPLSDKQAEKLGDIYKRLA